MRLHAAQLTAAQALSANPAALLLGIAALLAGTALAAFLVAAVPTLLVRALIEAIEQAQACINDAWPPPAREAGTRASRGPTRPCRKSRHGGGRARAGSARRAAAGAGADGHAGAGAAGDGGCAAAVRPGAIRLLRGGVAAQARAPRRRGRPLLRMLGRCCARRVSADLDSYTTASCCVPPI